MALTTILLSGFEMNSSTDGGLWNGASGQVSNSSTQKNTGSYAGRSNPGNGQSGYWEKIGDAGVIHAGFRFWLYIATAHSEAAAQKIVGFCAAASGGTPIVSLRITSGNVLQLWNDTGTPAQIGSSSSALNTSAWYLVEFFWNSNGTTSAYLNGTQFATGTGPTSTAVQWFRLGLSTNLTADSDYYFDDVRIRVDPNSSSQTSTMGDGRLVMLRPNAAGSNAMGSRGGADSGSDYGQVDDNPPENGTSYYILDVNNDILDVNLEPATGTIPDESIITVLAVNCSVAGATVSQCAFKRRIIEGGTATDETTAITVAYAYTSGYAINGTYGTNYRHPWVRSTNPRTAAAFTISQIDGMEVGVKATDAAPDVYVDAIWVVVDYKPNYKLSCDAGSLATSVGSATITATHVPLSADVASYSVTVSSATLTKGTGPKILAADSVSYLSTVADATARANRELTADAGSCTSAVDGAALRHTRLPLSADAGSYSSTATDGTLRYARAVNATPGSISTSIGNAALSATHLPLDAIAGLSSSSVEDATLRIAIRLTVVAGSLSGAVEDAGLRVGRKITAVTGALAAAGVDAAFSLDRVLAVDVVTASVAVPDAGLVYTPVGGGSTYTITGDEAGLVLAASPATFRRTLVLTAASGSFAIAGQAATFIRSYHLVAATRAFALAGKAATFRRGLKLPATVASYMLTVGTAIPEPARRFVVAAGDFKAEWEAAVLRRLATLPAVAASYIFDPLPVSFWVQRAANRLVADPAAYVLDFEQIGQKWLQVLTADPGTYSCEIGGVRILVARVGQARAGDYRSRYLWKRTREYAPGRW